MTEISKETDESVKNEWSLYANLISNSFKLLPRSISSRFVMNREFGSGSSDQGDFWFGSKEGFQMLRHGQMVEQLSNKRRGA